MDTPKYVVLGANGYIGRHIIKMLTDKGYGILAVDIQKSSIMENIPYMQLDIKGKDWVEKTDLSSDYIIFLSGLTGTYGGFENYEQYVLANEIGLLNVLNSIRKYSKKPRVIFSSSRLVYKGNENPITEDGQKECKTIYAINKLACENILKAYANVFKIPYTIFRTCVPYGNLFNDNYSFGTIGFFLKNAKNKQPIVLYGDGSMRRTFTHIEDVCEQILLAGIHPDAVNTVYNIGGESFSLVEAASLFAKKYNVEVKFCPWPENDLLIESGHTVFNSEKIEKLLNRPLKYKLKDYICNNEWGIINV
ncbi:MAG: NAD(P)-dependent oxidoreductase [Candidatus Omnitrophota bacterium]|nr:NAD(P)-dependent oxidoreductase [Candidatus Omnitrophota bacterium]